MKVVLFCGGLGMRLKDTEESLPKPLVKIGNMPILWHVMKYYAYYGHKDFILCLGYKADLIKQHFLNYNECLLNDFVLTNGGRSVELLSSDMRDWKITFVDTGMYCTVGQRLKLVQRHLEGEEMFLTNYSDGLTNMPLTELIDFAKQQNTVATFLCVKPNLTYHFVSLNDHGSVTDIRDIHKSNIRINGGFYVFRKGIFDYIQNGEELVQGPFQRLIQDRQLTAFSYDGFWAAMDTFKDKQQLEELHARGHAPWEVWKNPLPEAKTN
jgi:glucose-1-phosphate cytidylyltransferase